MSQPRLLTQEELELVRDTNGAVLNGADGGPEIWGQDVVHTALFLMYCVRNHHGFEPHSH